MEKKLVVQRKTRQSRGKLEATAGVITRRGNEKEETVFREEADGPRVRREII